MYVEIYIKNANHTFFNEVDLKGYVPQIGSHLTFEDEYVETMVQKVEFDVYREVLKIEVQPVAGMFESTKEYLMNQGWSKIK